MFEIKKEEIVLEKGFENLLLGAKFNRKANKSAAEILVGFY
jgi:hypothetical protein